ncbi:type II CAAX endopeptidase family protein [Lacticaseibacillus parahuelsenbergensis]|uniref:Type II CAAX endopeptidase family protein n=1 Tax=Lacticaseibacillus parahuelsenbergensis TaxID=3068305 RepID=A0ABY9L1Z2_9LACO|nr:MULTISPECIES: type II CAAX endopeptidase family protein [Lacticaseibacillus]MDE3283627.1 CPBP family intramembrane metalloprotease [Lacticaseibacillus casei]WLV77741.1 type II CAAX endopeptidase family protein [Lacticaseibacillus sp. NCIMB 15471]
MALMYFLEPLPVIFLMFMADAKTSLGLIELASTFIVADAVIIFVAYRFVRKYTNTNLLQKASFHDLLYIFGGFVFQSVSNAFFAYLNYITSSQMQTPNNQVLERFLFSHHQLMVGMLIINMIFITPIVEELVFRGMVFSLFFNSNQAWLKIILSALLFSSVHESNTIFGFLLYAASGIALGFVYWKSGKLQNSIVLHALMNFFAVLSMFSII